MQKMKIQHLEKIAKNMACFGDLEEPGFISFCLEQNKISRNSMFINFMENKESKTKMKMICVEVHWS